MHLLFQFLTISFLTPNISLLYESLTTNLVWETSHLLWHTRCKSSAQRVNPQEGGGYFLYFLANLDCAFAHPNCLCICYTEHIWLTCRTACSKTNHSNFHVIFIWKYGRAACRCLGFTGYRLIFSERH